MGELIYSAITSLDGVTADEQGNFDWAAPDEQVHRAVNDLERGIGTYLYGRRMYETMRFWEDAHLRADANEITIDYATVWRSADKIVYSTTNPRVTTDRTRVEPVFDPAVVGQLVADSPADVSIGGPTLAAHALRAGLVSAVHLYVVPVVVGGGTRVWPDGLELRLQLVDENRFANGTVHLAYRVLR